MCKFLQIKSGKNDKPMRNHLTTNFLKSFCQMFLKFWDENGKMFTITHVFIVYIRALSAPELLDLPLFEKNTLIMYTIYGLYTTYHHAPKG